MRQKNMQKKEQKKVARKLRKIETTLENKAYATAKNDFVELFFICEVVIKSLINSYNQAKGKKVAERDIRLDMNVIRATMRYFGYSIDDAILVAVFGSETTRNRKTCKKLRDGIAHTMSSEDIIEVFNRRNYLHFCMTQFLNHIREAAGSTPTRRTNAGAKTARQIIELKVSLPNPKLCT